MNVGNPEEFTIPELAELVIEVVGSKSRIESRPLPHNHLRQRKPDTSLARMTLDWQPKVELKDGLKETADYFGGLLRS